MPEESDMDRHPAPRPGAAGAVSGRPVAPWGRRACEVTESRASGGYRVFSLLDREGPEPQPGQFYMLAAQRHWEERGGRPFLPRAFSVAECTTGSRSAFVDNSATNGERTAVQLDFLI